MDISPNRATPLVESTDGADLHPPERPSVRRRLIQSTLLPHKPLDNVAIEDQDFGPDEDQDDDDEEYCGSSQGKKNRKLKPKGGIQSRASLKVAVNAKETQKKKIDEEDLPVTVKADFFLKVSERQQQKRQQREQEPVYLPDNNDKTCLRADITANGKSSPQMKQQADATPRKKRVSITPTKIAEGTPNEACCDTKSSPQMKQRANATPRKKGMSTTPTNTPNEACGDAKSPPQKKRRANSTPRKKRTVTTPTKIVEGTLNEACCGSMLANPLNVQGGNMSQPIPDLRLEAKLTAEENSRLFAGKQIHPFFSSRKTAKRNLETIDLDNNWGSIERKGKRISFSPIHVFEKVQDEAFALDWGNWIFSNRNFASSSWRLESVCLPVNERSVNALDFDNFLDILPAETSFCENEGSSNRFPVLLEESSLDYSPLQQDKFPALTSECLADEDVTHCDQQGDKEVGHGIGKVECFSEKAKFIQNLDVKWQGIYLQERMTSDNHGGDGQPENSLWTNKYQPEKAMEICGNSESVKFLNEWLHLWHLKCSRISTTNDHEQIMHKDDYCPSDSDSEDVAEETTLKNVILVTGPVGSGKSAAIYACAKEQGFQVIEVNASDWRSGALVKQKFGEAVESHWLKCNLQSLEDSCKRILLKPSSDTCNARADLGPDNDIIELIPVSDGEDFIDTSNTPRKSFCKEKTISRDQSELKTLILFEDVDATLYEDRGFIATIQQLAETAKRPMILTSNSDNPILPNNLDRLEISFAMPSPKELLSLVYMVCTLEKAQIEPSIVERFIDNCQGDIRKTITHLQFWCQGESLRKDNEVPKRYAPLIFDLDAGHHILPHIVPCGYPSHMSEVIEKEISKSLSMEEKNVTLTGIVEEEEEKYSSDPRLYATEPDCIEAQKDAMLSRHCSDPDAEFTVQFGSTTELSSSSQSPVAFNRRNVRKRRDAIISSGSEDECPSDRFPGNRFEHMNNEMSETNGKSPPHWANESSFNSTGEQLLWEGEMGDSHIEHVEALPKTCEIIDECSHMVFSRRSKSMQKPLSSFATDIVQETWRKLRLGHIDLEQYISPDEKDASKVLGLACRMTNLISEADLLFGDCQSSTHDCLEPSMLPLDNSHSFSWYDDQLQMASTIGQHGMCLFAKQTTVVGSTASRVDLAREMLALSRNTMALGKLIGQDTSMIRSSEKGPPRCSSSSKSEQESALCSVVQSLVPPRSCLTLKGNVFHEYLSSLAQISRSESSRLSECISNSRRKRGRVSRNYLSTGALGLSPEDISLLCQYNSYELVSDQPTGRN